MANVMKKNSDTPPPPLEVRERLRKSRYSLISSSDSLFHNSQPPTTATTTGIPTKRSSQKIASRMKLTKFPIVQRPRVLGTKPVDCISHESQENIDRTSNCQNARHHKRGNCPPMLPHESLPVRTHIHSSYIRHQIPLLLLHNSQIR